jgi:hypothetical protein
MPAQLAPDFVFQERGRFSHVASNEKGRPVRTANDASRNFAGREQSQRVVRTPLTKSAVPMMTTIMMAMAIHWIAFGGGRIGAGEIDGADCS